MTHRAASYTRGAVQLLIAAFLCLLLVYISVKRSPVAAGVLVLLPAVCYGLTRQLGGVIGGLALLLVIPSWYTLGTPQAGVLRVACLFALTTWLFGQRRRLTWTDVALGALVLIAVAGLYLQDNQSHAGRILLSELEPLAFFLAARPLSTKAVARLLDVVFLLGTVGALSVLYEFAAGHLIFQDPSNYYWNPSNTTIFRPGGVFGSPPAAATVLTLTALCGLPAIRRLSGWRRYVASACLLLTLVAMVSTFTRAALVAFALALLGYLWLSRSPLLRPAPVITGLTVLAVVALLLVPRIEGNVVLQRGLIRPGTFTARVSYWGLAMPIATASLKNFVLGIGSEAAEVPLVGGTAPAPLAAAPVLIAHGTHNQYVLVLLEQGLLGLIALVAWLGTAFGTAVSAARGTRDPVPSALAAGIVAFAVIMLADNTMLNGPSLALGALLTGLTVAYRYGQGRQGEQRPVASEV